MTDIIKTLGPGCDFASINALSAAAPVDMVAATENWIIHVPASFTLNTKQTLANRVTSNAYRITFKPAPGAGHNERGDKLASPTRLDPAKGVCITIDVGYDNGFDLLCPRTKIDGLQIKFPTFDMLTGLNVAAAECDIQNNIIEHNGYAAASAILAFQDYGAPMNAVGSKSVNNILRSTCPAGYSPRGLYLEATNCEITDTIVHAANGSAGQGFYTYDSLTNTFTNCMMFGYAGVGGTLAGSNNVTDRATFAIGTNNLVNQVFADTFTGANDYRIKLGAPAIGTGIVVAGRTTDMFGQAVAAPITPGPLQYIGAVADTTAPTMTGTMGSSGITPTGYTLDWSGTTRGDNVAIGGYQHSPDNATWTDVGNVTNKTFTGKTASTLYPNYVRAYDTATPPNYSTPALLLNVTTSAPSGDTSAPNLSGSITQGTITQTSSAISWPAATDDVAVDHYEVSKDGGTTWTPVGNVLNYTFTGLTAATLYPQRVRAHDAAGNISAILAASVTTNGLASRTWTPLSRFKNIMGGGRAAVTCHAIINTMAGVHVVTKSGLVTDAEGDLAPFTTTEGTLAVEHQLTLVETAVPTSRALEIVTPT